MWIYKDDDISEMYEGQSGNRTIPTHACTKAVSTGKCKAYLDSRTLSDVDEICAKLSEKHKEKYSKDQLRVWAHMISMGMYESYDEAPFWKGRKQQCDDQANGICGFSIKESWDQIRIDYAVKAMACITRVWSN